MPTNPQPRQTITFRPTGENALIAATVETRKNRKGQLSVTTADGVRRVIFVSQIVEPDASIEDICVLPSCGQKLSDVYVVTETGKMHRGCAGSPARPQRSYSEIQSEKAADRAEREIERRLP